MINFERMAQLLTAGNEIIPLEIPLERELSCGKRRCKSKNSLKREPSPITPTWTERGRELWRRKEKDGKRAKSDSPKRLCHYFGNLPTLPASSSTKTGRILP